MATTVRHVAVQREEHTEREAWRNGATDIAQDNWKLKRRTFDALKGAANRVEKLAAETGPFAVVPHRGRKRLGLGLRADPELRHLPATAQLTLQPLDYLFPGPRIVGGGAMGGETLLQQLPLPVGKRDLIDTGRNPVPQ
jgi:hypothetical protein